MTGIFHTPVDLVRPHLVIAIGTELVAYYNCMALYQLSSSYISGQRPCLPRASVSDIFYIVNQCAHRWAIPVNRQ